ncbi:PhzF family phenazine biosynthesis protein [Candida albicans P75016]|nr:PhzF family phenazine biosynthesis protein [Candida albicans P75016]
MPRFKQVDVFTNVKYLGNPVAVIYDSDNLTTQEMQKIARWTNLSETTFILTPKSSIADYSIRIFTSGGNELPFAGHPTLGTAFALLEDGKIKPNDNGQIIQECGAGLVKISVEKTPNNNSNNNSNELPFLLSFELPYFKFHEIDDKVIEELQHSWNGTNIIGKPVLIDAGPKWAVFQLGSGKEVLDLNVDLAQIERLSLENGWTGIGVFGKHNENGDSVELRNIAPAVGVAEDPACGSGSGAIGAYLANHVFNEKEKFTIDISQGKPIERDAKIQVKVNRLSTKNGDLSIHVGGHAITCFEGTYSI